MRRMNKLHDFGFYGESPEAFFNLKNRALVKLKSNIAYGGGGSAPSQPTSQTVTQVTIPPELMPYAKTLLGTGEKLAYGTPYESYTGQRVASLNPLQQQGFSQTQGQQPASQLGQATGFAGLAALQSQQAGKYNPMQERQFYNPMDVSYMGTTAPQLEQYQMNAPQDVRAQRLKQYQMGGPERVSGPSDMERVAAGQFGGAEAGQYMSPYMQNVVDVQKQQAVQDYMRQVPGTQAAAARSGARGGTREALLQGEANRNLQQQLQGIQAAGSQQAFQQAQQQFNVDQARALQAAQANQAMTGQYGQMGLQAALANQQAGLTTGQQNLAALLQTQGLSAQQAMQAALANQQAGLTTGQQNLAAKLGVQQLGAGQNLQSQQLNQAAQLQAQQQALAQRQAMGQLGLQGAQLGEQSRQFGANLGLQGIQQQLAAAGMLGQLGQQQFGQQQAINQAQLSAGQQLQQMEQARLDAAYQDYLARQRYPYSQLGFMSDLIRGTPTAGGIQTMYQAPPSPLSTVAGLGALAYGAGR